MRVAKGGRVSLLGSKHQDLEWRMRGGDLVITTAGQVVNGLRITGNVKTSLGAVLNRELRSLPRPNSPVGSKLSRFCCQAR